jgi:hypothetical protein
VKYFHKLILALGIPSLMVLGGLAVPNMAYASPANQVTNGINAAGGDKACDSSDCSIGTTVKNITNVLLFIVGAVAVIMIILGGIRYVTSNGDASQVTAAKNTILYSVIGLVVALLAYAIVNFIITQFTK